MPDPLHSAARSRGAARRRRCLVVVAASATLATAAAMALAPGPHAAAMDDPPAGGRAGDTPQDDAAPAVAPIPVLEPGARVIVREIGRRRHPGVLEVHSPDLTVIRDPDGEVRSFPGSRVVEVTALLPPNSGRDMAVYLVTGAVRVGRVIEDGWDRVVLEIDGVRVPMARTDIATTRILPTFQEEMAHRRRLVEPADPGSWIDFCDWLVDREQWTLAAEETRKLLDRHPRAREAERLNRIAMGQLALAASREVRAGTAGAGREAGDAEAAAGRTDDQTAARTEAAGDQRPETSGDPPRRGRDGDAFERSRLSKEDVNAIRVFEIDFQDPPRVMVPRPLVERIVREHGDSPLLPADDRQRERLHQAEPIDLVRLIFELRARELYPEIQVLTEPAALKLYRRAVHDSWLINTCGECHAGPDAGAFRLHVREPRSAETAMSNLLILERLVLPNTGPLIDWDEPEASRIIQYALPRFRARYPHPEVPGFRPAFRDFGDRRVEQSLRWIRSMYQPRPTYPVEYDPAAVIRAAALEAEAAAAESAGGDRDGGDAERGAGGATPPRPAR